MEIDRDDKLEEQLLSDIMDRKILDKNKKMEENEKALENKNVETEKGKRVMKLRN